MVSKTLGVLVLALVFTQNAFAISSSYDLNQVQSLTNEVTEQLLETVSIGADHRSYMPATPLGLAIGLDFGVQVTFIPLPSAFRDGLDKVVEADVSDIPGVIPAPRLSLHKGLGLGMEAGVSWVGYKGNRLLGLDFKWAFVREGSRKRVAFDAANPSVAIRGSYNSARIWFIETTTYSVDLLVSKPLFLIDPYLGLGWQFASGKLKIPNQNLVPLNVKTSESFSSPRILVGTPIYLLLFTLTAEASYSFSKIFNYGAKLSFTF